MELDSRAETQYAKSSWKVRCVSFLLARLDEDCPLCALASVPRLMEYVWSFVPMNRIANIQACTPARAVALYSTDAVSD